MKQEFNLDEAALAEFTARFALHADASAAADDASVAEQFELCIVPAKKITLPV